jgi:hypothetical protein
VCRRRRLRLEVDEIERGWIEERDMCEGHAVGFRLILWKWDEFGDRGRRDNEGDEFMT